MDILQKAGKLEIVVPEGAFYLMVRLDGVDSEGFARFLLEDFQLDGETVLVAPGPGFYATEGLGTDEIRIAYILKGEMMKRAGRIIREGYAAYRARPESAKREGRAAAARHSA